MNKKLKFDRKKIIAHCKISRNLLFGEKLNVGRDGIDFAVDQLTLQLEAQFLLHTSEEREINFICDKPKFLDWLFSRRPIAKFNFKMCDVLKNPAKHIKGTKRIVIIE